MLKSFKNDSGYSLSLTLRSSIYQDLDLFLYQVYSLIIFQFAVIDYDPGTHDLKTRRLHFFEDDKFIKVC